MTLPSFKFNKIEFEPEYYRKNIEKVQESSNIESTVSNLFHCGETEKSANWNNFNDSVTIE